MKYIPVMALCVAIGLLGFHYGRKSALMPSFGDVLVDVGSSVVRDTFTLSSPSFVSVSVIGAISVPVNDAVHADSGLIAHLPRELKVYETPRFRAEVSGFMASLDNIEIYGESMNVTRTIRERARKNVLTIGAEPMWAGGFRLPVMADYSRAVLPWLDIGAGIGYDPVSRLPVMRASARVRLSW